MAKKNEDAKEVKTKKTVPEKTESRRDKLASSIYEGLNKKFKDVKVAYFLDGSEETPTDLTAWVSTGSSLLDLAISNKVDGGFPCGRIIEITGLEGCVTEDTLIDIIIE